MPPESEILSNPLVLVDGSSYLFRAYHVPYLQALSTSYGQPTGAITGVLNMIKSLQKDYPNGNIVVVFDAKGKTFRNDMFADSKRIAHQCQTTSEHKLHRYMK